MIGDRLSCEIFYKGDLVAEGILEIDGTNQVEIKYKGMMISASYNVSIGDIVNAVISIDSNNLSRNFNVSGTISKSHIKLNGDGLSVLLKKLLN